MISLIFPKLILSVARDGIWTFYDGWQKKPGFQLLLNDRRQASRVQGRACQSFNRWFVVPYLKWSIFREKQIVGRRPQLVGLRPSKAWVSSILPPPWHRHLQVSF